MWPTLKEDAIFEIETNYISVDVNDIILFISNGKAICHRVIDSIQSANGTVFYITKGDHNLMRDESVITESMIVGKLIL